MISNGIQLGDINVLVIDNTSGIFIGENFQSYWTTHTKTNSGFGEVSGRGNIVNNSTNIVIDPDEIDNPFYKTPL
jgi:hypothetical protein